MRRVGRRIRRALLALLLALVLTAGISAVVCRFSLKVTAYAVAVRGLTAPCRAVVLSDLHSREYGKENAALLARVAEQQPDAIFCIGDFISRDATEAELQQLYALLRRLGEIAPVFWSPGNHEVAYMNDHGFGLLDTVAAAGATVLYDTWVQTTLGGAAVRIGGSCGHCRDINQYVKLDYAMEESIGASGVPGIVLLHMPESLLLDDARERWTGQVFLSGHTHGGVIRIPLIGGLVAPTQGFFPKYDQGEFTIDGRMTLIITSGLAGYDWVPRIFNRPEVCVVDLQPGEGD